jgi:hypothetical protein
VANLFDLLLEKNTIYIYGNHDPKDLCDERCSLFAVETVIVVNSNGAVKNLL